MRRKEYTTTAHLLEDRCRTFRKGKVPTLDAAGVRRYFAGQLLECREPEKEFTRVVREIADERAVKL
jgi:hypothetical protein